MTFALHSICNNFHLTSTPLVNAEVTDDGEVNGYAGSDADFCPICQSTHMTPLSVSEQEEGSQP